jgi:ubiquinone/menaquinone biosynthesis C-methylase UbiE
VTTLPALEAYRVLAAGYDTEPNALIALEERLMPRLLPTLTSRTFIDVGTGTGRWAKYAAANGARAIGIDFCEEMLRAGGGPASVLADACQLPLPDECADVVLCAFTFGYAPGCFSELRRISRVGGMVAVSDVHPGALERGWKRRFRHNNGPIEIACQTYQISDLHSLGMELIDLIEPRLGLPEKVIFDQAGCPDRFEEAAREPAIFIALFRRIGS